MSGYVQLVAHGGGNTAGPIDVATTCSTKSRMDFASETIVTHTLRGEGFDASEDGTGRGTPLVPVEAVEDFEGWFAKTRNLGGSREEWEALRACDPVAFSCKDYGADAGDIAPTLRAMGHGASHANAGGQVAVAFQTSQSGVRTSETHATLDANNGSRRHNGVIWFDGVRRLMPIECERLQGLPDNWARIPWRGKPAELCPDGPRYKAIGNGVAVPVVEWIARRIRAVDGVSAR